MNKLFCDLKTDEEKAEFFLSGRGYETGVIAHSIQNDVAMAYHRCAEYKKELATLQAERDALRADVAEWKRVAAAQAELHGEAEERAKRLAEALEEIRSRSSMNLAMQSDPSALVARLGDIYQIADAALAQEDRND